MDNFHEVLNVGRFVCNLVVGSPHSLNESIPVDEEEINLEVWYVSHTMGPAEAQLAQLVRGPLVVVPTIRGTKDNVQKGPGW